MLHREPYQHYRALMTPYVRYMTLLRSLFCTCGMEVSPQETILLTGPRWMSRDAAAHHTKAAQAIAHIRHACTLADKEVV